MRLKCLHPVILINPVSIHASVKDATVPLVSEYTGKSVSIHASVKDATLLAPIPEKDATIDTGFEVPPELFQSTHL